MTIVIRRARPNDAEGIARVHVASWRTTYRGLLPDAYLDSLAVENRARFYRDRVADPNTTSVAFVAVDVEQDAIIGYAIGGPQHDEAFSPDSELYAIYLLADYQRTGTGRRLVQAITQALHERGYHSLLLWALSTNPSRGFYESLGGTCIGEKPITLGSATVTKVAYSWPAITDLIAVATEAQRNE